MPNDELNGSGVPVPEHCVSVSEDGKEVEVGNMSEDKEGGGLNSCAVEGASKAHTVIPIAVVVEPRRSVGSNGATLNPVSVISEPRGIVLKKDERADLFPNPKKGCLPRSESSHEQCRVCQQQLEEPLIDLGCQCRGGLAKAHRSCIDTWFHTRGSNRCEICQQVATNVDPPESQQSRNYWVWRIDPTIRRSGIALEHERGCYGPLWVAFSILIGGLLLDVLISISLGVSALPVNIIIGVLVVLGLGTALRLALECCHEITLRRAATQSMDATITLTPIGYHPAV